MKIFSKTAILTLILALVSSQAFSRGGRGGKRGRGLEKVLSQLNLSKEQMQKIKSFKQNTKSSRRETRSKIQAARKEMNEAFNSSASDSDLMAKHDKLKKLKAEMADLRFDKMLKIRSVLTSEQRSKYYKLKQGMREGK